MSIQNLKTSIEKATEQKVEEIISEAKKEAENVIEDANRRAEKMREEIVKTKKGELEVKERSELAMEELKWKKKALEAKAQVLDRIFTEAENKIAQITNEPRYKEFLKSSTIEAIQNIQGSEFVISTNKNDALLIKKSLQDIDEKVKKMKGEKVKIGFSKDYINTIGGVLVYDKNMREYYNNTVEALLLRSKINLKGILYKEVFRG